MTDAGNQIAWMVHCRSLFDPPAPSIERFLTLRTMPFLPVARNRISNYAQSGVHLKFRDSEPVNA